MQHDPESLGLTNNETNSTPGDDTRHNVEALAGKIHVFFDGTGNNYFNTVDTPPEQRVQRDDSYGNDLTNVARMWEALGRGGNIIAVYVEGIGTIQKQSDSTLGMGLGMGDTGIVHRVRGAFQQIQEKYRTINPDEKNLPAIFDVNVFGFSRGAAAARHFAYLLNTEPEKYFTGEWLKPKMRINFLGLYDCVAHYGFMQDNDVEDLHLNFDEKNQARKVFHLVAADEYRDNFNLTDIQSALTQQVETFDGNRPMGRELRIPGAHADVGGNYRPEETETHTFDRTTLEPWAFKQGWYAEQHCIHDGYRSRKELYLRPPARTFRRTVAGESWRIALTLMVDQANRQIPGLFINPSLTRAPTDTLLQRLHQELRTFAQNEQNSEWKPEAQQWSEDAIKVLRHQYLHLSFSDKFAMGPRLNKQGLPQRQIMPG